jgi:hypothetical protein
LNITPSTTVHSHNTNKSVHSVDLFKSPPFFDWFLRHCHRRAEAAERPRASPLLAGLAYGCSSGAASARQVPQIGAVIPIQNRAPLTSLVRQSMPSVLVEWGVRSKVFDVSLCCSLPQQSYLPQPHTSAPPLSGADVVQCVMSTVLGNACH